MRPALTFLAAMEWNGAASAVATARPMISKITPIATNISNTSREKNTFR